MLGPMIRRDPRSNHTAPPRPHAAVQHTGPRYEPPRCGAGATLPPARASRQAPEIMAVAAGTTAAWRRIMRAVLACLLLAGCVGAGVGPSAATGTRPGVMPMLSELPNDATKRNAILDSAANTAGPEQRSGLTTK